MYYTISYIELGDLEVGTWQSDKYVLNWMQMMGAVHLEMYSSLNVIVLNITEKILLL